MLDVEPCHPIIHLICQLWIRTGWVVRMRLGKCLYLSDPRLNLPLSSSNVNFITRAALSNPTSVELIFCEKPVVGFLLFGDRKLKKWPEGYEQICLMHSCKAITQPPPYTALRCRSLRLANENRLEQ